MKRAILVLRTGLIVASVLIVLSLTASYLSTCNSYREEKRKINRISTLISLGDDIYESRERLVKDGFKVSDISFATIDRNELTLLVRLTDYDSIDGFERSIETRLRPWRNKLIYSLSVRADASGKIISFSENIIGDNDESS